MSPEKQIVSFASAPPAMPAEVIERAQQLLADTLKVGAAGSWTTEAQALAGRCPPGPSRLLSGGQGDPQAAAFANGFAIHCLEWDPVHEEAVVHACSVVTATLLALADRDGRSGDCVVDAFVVGVEIAAGLGLAATGGMRFFRPAYAGVIGAALAGAHLLDFDEACCAKVLGLAYSFAGGTMQAHAEGSIALPLQIGAAARSAVTAVECIEADLSGPHDVLAGPFGYANLIEPLDFDRWLPRLGTRWLTSEVSLKPWPCGRASHGLLSAIGLAEIEPGDLRGLTAYVPPLVQRLVGRPASVAMTPAYARLCGPFLAALMFDEGRIDPRRFTAAEFASPALHALAGQVTIDLDSNADPNALSPQRFLFEDEEGMTDIRLDHVIGSPDSPMSADLASDRDALLAELAGPARQALVVDPLRWLEGGR